MNNLFSSNLFGEMSSFSNKMNNNNSSTNNQYEKKLINTNNTNKDIIQKSPNNYYALNKSVKDYGYSLEDNNKYRNSMEDFIYCNDNFLDREELGVFIVLDGHGGKDAAEYAVKRLPEIIKTKLKYKDSDLIHSIEQSFIDIDKELQFYIDKTSGTTATLVYIENNKLICSNVGDSSAKLFDFKSNYSKTLSFDHRIMYNKEEQERIISNKGIIKNNRVNGSLMLSRSLGDHYLQDFGLTPIPQSTKEIILNKEDKYLIIASDGVWDVLDDNMIFDLKYDLGFSNNIKCQIISDNIVKKCKQLESKDNISCIVIKL